MQYLTSAPCIVEHFSSYNTTKIVDQSSNKYTYTRESPKRKIIDFPNFFFLIPGVCGTCRSSAAVIWSTRLSWRTKPPVRPMPRRISTQRWHLHTRIDDATSSCTWTTDWTLVTSSTRTASTYHWPILTCTRCSRTNSTGRSGTSTSTTRTISFRRISPFRWASSAGWADGDAFGKSREWFRVIFFFFCSRVRMSTGSPSSRRDLTRISLRSWRLMESGPMVLTT